MKLSEIIARKLLDPKDRHIIECLAENGFCGDVRVGVYGPTIAELKPLLKKVPPFEATK